MIDDFEKGLKKDWEERKFRRKNDYSIVQNGDNKVLKIVSKSSASVLIFRHQFDTKEFPIITWRWKIERVLKGGDGRRKNGDDYAARIYIVFPHWFFPKTKAINYIWANKIARESIIPNVFNSNSVMIAVECGEEKAGRWVSERRNIYEDYKKAFGSEPGHAGGIAIMTDTDQTGENAVAYYDDLRLEGR